MTIVEEAEAALKTLAGDLHNMKTALEGRDEAVKELEGRVKALEAVVREAVAIVEGRPDRSPFVAVEEWKRVLDRKMWT